MTVQRCARTRIGWTGTGTVTGGNEFTVSYLVETNSNDDGPLSIALESENVGPDSIPAIFDTYSIGNDVDSTVVHTQRTTRKIKDIATGALWQVDCQFARPGTNEVSDLNPPLQRPTKYRVEWAQFEWDAYYDNNGNPILNTAGQAYPQSIEIDDSRPVFVAEKDMPNLVGVVSLASTYRNAVNTDYFYGAAPRHAKVQSITCGDMETEDGVSFYPTVFRIQMSDTPWDIVKREEGYAYWQRLVDGVPQNLQVATDDMANGFAEPVLLGSTGLRLADGADPIYTAWRVYPERNFSGLGI